MGLMDTFVSIVNDVVEGKPSTLFGRIINYYENTVTVETDNGLLENIKCVNVPVIGSPCILVPVDEEYICIPTQMDEYTREEIDEMISGGSVDLKQYVKKADVDLKFSLEDNGTIIFGIDVGDGF